MYYLQPIWEFLIGEFNPFILVVIVLLGFISNILFNTFILTITLFLIFLISCFIMDSLNFFLSLKQILFLLL